MLSACMQHHWEYCQDLDNKVSHSGTASPIRPSFSRTNASSSATWVPVEGIPSVPIDPPPLEDNLAKHILFVMSRFVYQMGLFEEREHEIVANHASSTVSAEALTNMNGPISIMVDIYKAASRVIQYVSASNWAIVFAKIKNRILYLASTVDENPEITDCILLECASLNRKRLSMVLTGISPLLLLLFFFKKRRTKISFNYRIMQLYFTFKKIFSVNYCCHVEKSHLELDRKLYCRICFNVPESNSY